MISVERPPGRINEPRVSIADNLSKHTDPLPTVQRNRFRYELVRRQISPDSAPVLGPLAATVVAATVVAATVIAATVVAAMFAVRGVLHDRGVLRDRRILDDRRDRHDS